jgi:hypothetical protein
MTSDYSIGYEPKLTIEKGVYVENVNISIKDGSPIMIDELDAIKQWILKFVKTEKDVYSIYDGTEFGCSIKSLYGQKVVGYGYEEAIIEKEFKEGLLLCPAIVNIDEVTITKDGKKLNIYIQAELYNGDLIDVTVEDVYVIKG